MLNVKVQILVMMVPCQMVRIKTLLVLHLRRLDGAQVLGKGFKIGPIGSTILTRFQPVWKLILLLQPDRNKLAQHCQT